jgi:hypothetical protein
MPESREISSMKEIARREGVGDSDGEHDVMPDTGTRFRGEKVLQFHQSAWGDGHRRIGDPEGHTRFKFSN